MLGYGTRRYQVLSDRGDLTLKDSVSGLILWESFNYPCDTFLPEKWSMGWIKVYRGGGHRQWLWQWIQPYGTLTIMLGNEQVKNPYVTWMASLNRCDIYGVYGPFGVCNNNKSPNCLCLKGFVPSSTDEWWKGNWAGGCVRKTELLCEKNTSSLASSGKAHNDGFWKLSSMKLPDHHEYLYTKDSSGCQQWCFSNCSCVAYAYVTGIHCMVWSGGLVDIQQFPLAAGNDLFLRLSYLELGKDKKNKKFIIIFATISGVVLLGAFMYGMHRWRANQRVKRENMRKDFKIVDSMDTSELPIIDFDKILVATDNFSTTKKLGEGGFGLVCKGRLEDGYQVAVKRLSRHSGQGVEEFKNEIVLISKLQHRNLGRLLGCSIEGEEKLLVYEYMTNKSLGTFLFDATKRVKLDWAKHFHIIQGIARGLLYLHRDSYLRVIQRDLKANNILLDNDMNPKISDFGLARTFRVTQELENTHRVMENTNAKQRWREKTSTSREGGLSWASRRLALPSLPVVAFVNFHHSPLRSGYI
ncbi:unnamed protein product [Camellia sinensis]